jgi:glycosidase
MEKSALYHRPDSEMAYLYTNDDFHIRLRTKHDDVQSVELLYGDPYGMKVNEKDQGGWDYQTKKMDLIAATKVHDYWQTSVSMPLRRLQYAFHVVGKDGEEVLYDDRHLRSYNQEAIDNLAAFRMPYFHEIDRVKTPDWVKKTVWYQIFPERFANGNKLNDPKGTLPWGSTDPTPTNFFGGDLQGIIDHLDYLVDLGINGLYLCPIFYAHSNHKYDTIDYLEIDPAFGDKETLKKLIDEAHARGIKIMLDAVFNHLGDFSMQWQDVVKNGEKSRFADWFHVNKFPVSYEKTQNNELAKNITYDVFANTPHMPKLNTANPQVQDYLLGIATYWIKQFDIDAWRLDVANEIDHHFWRKFYQETHALKKDFYVLGEVWHSAQEWLSSHEFDAAMNYPFTELIGEYFINKKSTASEMVSRLNEQLMLYRRQTNEVMFNAMDTHDTARLLTLCQGNRQLQKQILTFMFLQIGVPCIYYGTEVGMAGGFDPGCRACMVWDPTKQDQQMLAFITKLVHLRRENADLLSKGQLIWKQVDDQKNLIVLQRKLGSQAITAVFNRSSQLQSIPKITGKVLLDQGLTKAGKLESYGFVIK